MMPLLRMDQVVMTVQAGKGLPAQGKQIPECRYIHICVKCQRPPEGAKTNWGVGVG